MTDSYNAQNSNSVAADHLYSFVNRLERLEDEIKELNDDKKEVYAEAKGTGFDVKVLRKVIARRRRDKSDIQEEEYLFELYEEALKSAKKQNTPKANESVNDDFLDN